MMITVAKAAAATTTMTTTTTTTTIIIQALFIYVMTQQPVIQPFHMVLNV
jgi:hypothetical protein